MLNWQVKMGLAIVVLSLLLYHRTDAETRLEALDDLGKPLYSPAFDIEILANDNDSKGYSRIGDTCPSYTDFCQVKTGKDHEPLSSGPLKLPHQRPTEECRTFHSDVLEEVISKYKDAIAPYSPDLARLFENALPNTLDTTIKYHQTSPPLTFVVTGDIDAEWLRDSHRQLGATMHLASKSEKIKTLILGAIALHSRYVSRFPYCNAFHAPPEAQLPWQVNNQDDRVWPPVDLRQVFECKQELDSLASFLGLANDYYELSGDTSFVTAQWYNAIDVMFKALQNLEVPTYNENTGQQFRPPYSFQRRHESSTETQSNSGLGNPVRHTGLLRSFFRPSDDATIYQFFIPANAQMSVELRRLSVLLADHEGSSSQRAEHALKLSQQIREAIYEHAVVDHPKFGKVFAYEIDGYGSHVLMDDANVPSLLSLPDLGFINMTDPIYVNTRKMIMSMQGNPYYIKGEYFSGIGGPHVGTRNAWPMSRLVAMRTTTNITEIAEHLTAVLKSTDGMGLIHETVNVDTGGFSRPWFAWANSEFAKSIFYLQDHGHLKEVLSKLDI